MFGCGCGCGWKGEPGKRGGVRACLWEFGMGGCLVPGLCYEVGALVVVLGNKRELAGVGV